MLGLYQTRPGMLLRGAESVQCGGLDKECLADTQRLCFGGNGKGMSTHALYQCTCTMTLQRAVLTNIMHRTPSTLPQVRWIRHSAHSAVARPQPQQLTLPLIPTGAAALIPSPTLTSSSRVRDLPTKVHGSPTWNSCITTLHPPS